jgi:hypothetical protein
MTVRKMIKMIIRSLFMWAFQKELMGLAAYARRNLSGYRPTEGVKKTGEVQGILLTLETLDLLVR